MPSNELWLSYSKINLFLHCPRAYYYTYVYRNPKTGRHLALANPSLSLGSIVHEVLESLSVIPVNRRLKVPLLQIFQQAWQKVSGKKGGFTSSQMEEQYFQRGRMMLSKLLKHPGPLARKAIKIKQNLPYFYLSREKGLILSGKIDWMEYLEDQDAIHIIDFKTSRITEKPDSLQLPIYALLASHLQSRPVVKTSYWYLDFADQPQSVPLPNLSHTKKQLLKIGQNISLAHSLLRFKCPHGESGCRYCHPFQQILDNKAEFIGLDERDREIYFLPSSTTTPSSYIL